MSDQPMNVDEVAAELRVNRRYVLDALRAKHLRGTNLGGRAGWRINRDDLQTYLDAKANVSKVRRSA